MKFIKILIPTFFVVGAINQSFYNFCMKAHCLSAAFPKVLILSVIVAAAITYFSDEQ